MSCIPTDVDALLTRDRLAAALNEVGFPVTTSTLATKATRGGGPAFMKFSNRPLYRWGDGLEWAKSQLTRPIHATAELDLGTAQSGDRPRKSRNDPPSEAA
jgi:hypothetical protein